MAGSAMTLTLLSWARMVGSVILPDAFRVFEIGDDYILGRYADELGVEYLRLFGLTRSG